MATATTIQQSVHPLLVARFIIGLGIYPLSQPKTCLSVVYCLAVWCVYSCCYCTLIIPEWDIIFHRTIYVVVHELNILTTITFVIVGLCYDKKLRMCIKKLAVVDDTLEELGTSKVYREVHRWSRRMVIGWLAFVLISNTFSILWWSATKYSYRISILPCILDHCHHVNLFVDLMFIFLMWCIGNRFDQVNEHIRYLLVREEHRLQGAWKKPVVAVCRHTLSADNHKRVLWTSMHLHSELCRIARELNLIFATPMTLEMLIYLLFLTMMTYYCCMMLLTRKEVSTYAWLGTGIWGCMYVTRLFSVNFVCERVMVKAKKINEVIHQLTNISRYANVREEIRQFTLQTLNYPLKFTGSGLFCFSSKLVWKFFTVIITFVILLMQWNSEVYQNYDPRSKTNNNTDVS